MCKAGTIIWGNKSMEIVQSLTLCDLVEALQSRQLSAIHNKKFSSHANHLMGRYGCHDCMLRTIAQQGTLSIAEPDSNTSSWWKVIIYFGQNQSFGKPYQLPYSNAGTSCLGLWPAANKSTVTGTTALEDSKCTLPHSDGSRYLHLPLRFDLINDGNLYRPCAFAAFAFAHWPLPCGPIWGNNMAPYTHWGLTPQP